METSVDSFHTNLGVHRLLIGLLENTVDFQLFMVHMLVTGWARVGVKLGGTVRGGGRFRAS